MRPEDRDILFGDRFGGWDGDPGASGVWAPEDALDQQRIDGLMDAYFDGEISADDRVRLFELLRRDPARCLQFVEMQRTAILLERAPLGPDQTETILARLDAAGAPRAPRAPRHTSRRRRYRIGPAASRLAIAAVVAMAGVGLVILGQSGPPRPQRAAMHSSPAGAAAPSEPSAPAAVAELRGPSRPALGYGRLSSTRTGLFTDPGQPELAISGLGSAAASAAPAFDAAALTPESARAAEMRRLIGFAYSGQPWRLLNAWPTPELPPEPEPAAQRPRPAPRSAGKPHAAE